MNQVEKVIKKEYGIAIQRSNVIKEEKGSSFVMELEDLAGNRYVLKTLYTTKQRQRFIVESENALIENGISLARPIKTKKNKWYFMYNQFPYVLYEWVDGNRHPLNTPDDLKSIIQTIGRMHHASYQLQYSEETKMFAQKNWYKDYRKRSKDLHRFYQSHRASLDPHTQLIVNAIPFFSRMASHALKYLKRSHYQSMVNKPNHKLSLIHGDAHQGNILCQDGQKTIIDLEDVYYEFPSKDILRIMSKYTKRHSFKGSLFDKMLEWYEAVNPLSSREREIVLIDCLFPHSFHRMVRLKKYKTQPLEELRHIIKQEKKKAKYIMATFLKT